MVDFSIRKVTNDQIAHDKDIFPHSNNIDWLSYAFLGMNFVGLFFFVVYFFTHKYHHSIQKTLNKKS
jgi:hypothetical protein